MKTGWFHLIALLVVVVWGTTFVSTKILLRNGLSPQDIFFYRFLPAYIGIRFFGKSQCFADNPKDEFLLALMGICGGSLYFIAENTALKITLASNVALLLATLPILTAVASHILLKSEKLNRFLMQGSLIALFGVVLVVYNGHFVLQIHPAGDLLTLAAALLWTFYTILLKFMGGKYSTLLITRKIFFYGLLTLLPLFLVQPLMTDFSVLSRPAVWGNLLFLGLAASLFCYFMWNMAVAKLGAIRTTHYLYIVPPVAMITSAVVINETITLAAIAGAVLILTGVVMAER